ncbi:four helix bundle protein [bacterium]|nr:four helix bundle protein [bacterium]
MSAIHDYHDLIVWQKAHRVSLLTISFVRRLPRDYIFREIGSQMFRAATSAEVNIAEGHSCHRGHEYERFLEYSYRSAFEYNNWLEIVEESPELRAAVDLVTLETLRAGNKETIALLTNLLKKLKL